MRLLVWLMGVLVILAGLELALSMHDGWRWVWILSGVTWILLGAGLALASLVKLALARAGGTLRMPGLGKSPQSKPSKEEA